jgi:hypothetical protein
LGIKSLDNEIVDYLNTEIEEKLKSILSVLKILTQQAKKFMRVTKRKTLKVDDLNHSLRFFNMKVHINLKTSPYTDMTHTPTQNLKESTRSTAFGDQSKT